MINKINITYFMLIFLFFSCNKKVEIKKAICILVENKYIKSNDYLNLLIINSSNENYFIIIDTNRIFDYPSLNNRYNESIHLKPVFYLGQDITNIRLETKVIKSIELDTNHYNCMKRQREFTDKYIKDFKNLKNILILKKHSKIKLKIPFKTKYENCNKCYNYLFDKENRYSIKFEYKLNEQLIEKEVSNAILLGLRNDSIKPFYDIITTNKVRLQL